MAGRYQARRQGLTHYDGNPCKTCGGRKRYTKTANCVRCMIRISTTWRKDHVERVKAYPKPNLGVRSPLCHKVLTYLQKGAGGIVSVDEFLEALWPVAGDTEPPLTMRQTLRHCILHLRKAGHSIQTHGRGRAFLGYSMAPTCTPGARPTGQS